MGAAGEEGAGTTGVSLAVGTSVVCSGATGAEVEQSLQTETTEEVAGLTTVQPGNVSRFSWQKARRSRRTTGAVGDGEGGGRGDSVGLAGVGDLSGLRAVSGDGGDDLSHVGGSSAVLGSLHLGSGDNASHGGGSDSGSETHFDIRCLDGGGSVGVEVLVVVVRERLFVVSSSECGWFCAG